MVISGNAYSGMRHNRPSHWINLARGQLNCPDFKCQYHRGSTVRNCHAQFDFTFLVDRAAHIRPRTWCALLLAPDALHGCHCVGPAQARPRRGTPLPCTANRRCPEDFTDVPYADPAAPKGGRLVQGVLGTFDSLNPLIVRGHRAAGDPRLRGRKPDGARLRRAVHALWADRPLGRNRRASAATSPSTSIPPRGSPTARRSRPKT